MENLSLQIPPAVFKQRVFNQYNNWSLALARELIQNSYDAKAKALSLIAEDGGFTAIDNGKGMTRREFQDFYLKLGGSSKTGGADSTGAFGAAKELVSLCWQDWSVASHDYTVTGQGAGNIAMHDSSSQDKGCVFAAVDSDIQGFNLRDSARLIAAMSHLPGFELSVGPSDDSLEVALQGRSLRSNQLYKQYTFGDLYVVKSGYKANEESGFIYIRTKGLYTTKVWGGGDYVYYLNVTGPSPEVLTENREGLRYSVQDRVVQDVRALIAKPTRVEQVSHCTVELHGVVGRSDGLAPAALTGTGGTGTFESHEGVFDKARPTEKISTSKPLTVARENDNRKITDGAGNLKPKYAKAMSVAQQAIGIIGSILGVEVVPGIYLGKDATAIHFSGEVETICVNVEFLLDKGTNNLMLFEVICHEFAHHWRRDHSQEFETARMYQVMGKLAPMAGGILDTFYKLLNK